MMSPLIREEGPQYFSFLVVGLLTFTFVQASVGALHGALSGEISTGSLEALLSTPTSLVALLAGMIGQAFSVTAARALLTLIFSVAFGFHVVWSGIPAALLALTLIVTAYLPFGIMAAALVLAFRTPGPFPAALLGISLMLGGVYYPTTAVPSWLEQVSIFVPLTYGLRALRRSLLDGASISASLADLGVLVAASAAFFVVGLYAFNLALRYAKHKGTLAQY
jgi:ABC-2 type transport system permease protein